MRADLHIHTTCSDGSETPTEVVHRAVAGSLDLVSVTDHDSADGVAEARAAAEGTPVEVISGTELSSSLDGRELHILGYGLDPEAAGIRAHAERAWTRRRDRMQAILDRLNEQLGADITLEEVREAAPANDPMIGRPHLARVLVNRELARDVPDAFDRFIADHHPAYVPTQLGEPADAIAVIREAGGVAVWAHPPSDLLEDLLERLVDEGLQGLEAYRPGWSRRRTRRVEEHAQAFDLVLTGGSDWHNPDRGGRLGDFWVTTARIQRFLHLLD